MERQANEVVRHSKIYLNLSLGNGGGKQGRGNRPPIDDRRPIRKVSISAVYQRQKPIRKFSINPTLVGTDRSFVDTAFADTVSETCKSPDKPRIEGGVGASKHFSNDVFSTAHPLIKEVNLQPLAELRGVGLSGIDLPHTKPSVSVNPFSAP